MADTHAHGDIILCPGQGAQYVGMGKPWVDRHHIAADTFAEADRVLGFELSRLCFEGPADELNRTDVAQAAIYTTTVACVRALQYMGKLNTIVAAAGLSLGEFTALHLAEAYDFDAGLQLVRLRGQAMQQAAEQSGGSGMVALVGAEEQQAKDLCTRTLEDLGDKAVLVPANYNCPGQVVISGSADACEKALTVAGDMGLRATPLTVAGAFHSPFMQPAADKLEAALDQVDWQPLHVPVVSNVTARPHDSDDLRSIKAHLVQQLTHPVRWSDSVQWMVGRYKGRYIEPAPGKVLSGLMRRIDRGTKVENFDTPA